MLRCTLPWAGRPHSGVPTAMHPQVRNSCQPPIVYSGMLRLPWLPLALLPVFAAACLGAQVPATPAQGTATVSAIPEAQPNAAMAAPLPDARTLLLDVERNEKRFEVARREYTYHVHLQQDELKKDGSVKKAEVTDSESLTIQGVRINRVVARNGVALTPDERAKESERVDKEVARAHERREKAATKGEPTDERGDTILSTARILELGTFHNERRIELAGRPTVVLDYNGNPGAKTHSAVENVVKDLVGTIWVDEAEHVMVRAEGHFLNDFKIGGGLLADVRKGTSFHFEAKRVDDAVWLPATIHGEGSVRVLLFAGFEGRMNLVASDYKRFHTSAKILPGQREVDANGDPVPEVVKPGPPPPPADTPQP